MKLESEMKPYQEQTYYELLEVPTGASEDEIRAAFERAWELYAPDSVAIYALEDPGQADELRERLKRAKETLTDSDLRDEYDRSIGLIPPLPPQDERDEDEPSQLAMAEVLAGAEAVHSTHPEFSVSYVPQGEPAKSEPVTVEARAEPREAVAEPPKPEPVPEARPERGGRTLETAHQIAAEDAIATAESAMAQISAKVRETPRAKALDIPSDAEFGGELLRRVRESRGLSLQQVSDRTRISVKHLENVEADHYKDLPATVYLRGILMNLAREYALDPIRVAKTYLALATKK